MRREGSRPARPTRQIEKRRHDDRPAAYYRALSYHIAAGVQKRTVDGRERVATDVERVEIYTERAVIEEGIRLARREEKIRPHGPAGDRCGIADGQHRAIGYRSVTVRHVDHFDEPASRQAIVADDSVSTNGKNVKIITVDGMVTLSGPVKTEQEKTNIGAKAQQIAGVKRVDNQLEITN